jgi:hypothetical protein
VLLVNIDNVNASLCLISAAPVFEIPISKPSVDEVPVVVPAVNLIEADRPVPSLI